MNRMLIKLYVFPILLMLGSPIFMYFLNTWMVEPLLKLSVLSGVGRVAQGFVPWVGMIMLIGAFILGAHSSYLLYQWSRGNGICCCNCGGLSKLRSGRYGFYNHCLICGYNESI